MLNCLWIKRFEESCRCQELAYVPFLCDASFLKASLWQRRHFSQCVESCFCEQAGIHRQANGNQPVRNRGDESWGYRLTANFCESSTWNLGRKKRKNREPLMLSTFACFTSLLFVFSSKLVEFHSRCSNFSHVTFVSMRVVWAERLRSLGKKHWQQFWQYRHSGQYPAAWLTFMYHSELVWDQ